MRFLALIAITALVACSFATTTEEEVQLKLNNMEKSKYGKTLLDTIELELSTNGPVEDLIRLLKQSEDELRKEQNEDDDFIMGLQEVCDKEIETLVTEITACKKRIAELEAELSEKIPIRDEKVKVRKEKANFRKLLNEKIAELDANKAIRDAEWAETQQQHDAAQYIIERAKQIIVDALKSASFLQTKGATNLVQVSQHFQKHAKTNFKRKSWNHIFSLLAQITASQGIQSDQSLVQKVIDLCDQLLSKIAESREIERKDYTHWVEEYQKTRNGLSDKVSELTGQINQLDTEIDTLTKRINAATAEKQDQETRRDQKQQEHDERLRYCDEENVNYANRRQARYDQISVVSDAIALLQSHLRLFRQYVADRSKNIQKAK